MKFKDIKKIGCSDVSCDYAYGVTPVLDLEERAFFHFNNDMEIKKSDYNKIKKIFTKFEKELVKACSIKVDDNINIDVVYDVSGFDYWFKNEDNYYYISVSCGNEMKDDEKQISEATLNKIEKAVNKAIIKMDELGFKAENEMNKILDGICYWDSPYSL